MAAVLSLGGCYDYTEPPADQTKVLYTPETYQGYLYNTLLVPYDEARDPAVYGNPVGSLSASPTYTTVEVAVKSYREPPTAARLPEQREQQLRLHPPREPHHRD